MEKIKFKKWFLLKRVDLRLYTKIYFVYHGKCQIICFEIWKPNPHIYSCIDSNYFVWIDYFTFLYT